MYQVNIVSLFSVMYQNRKTSMTTDLLKKMGKKISRCTDNYEYIKTYWIRKLLDTYMSGFEHKIVKKYDLICLVFQKSI